MQWKLRREKFGVHCNILSYDWSNFTKTMLKEFLFLSVWYWKVKICFQSKTYIICKLVSSLLCTNSYAVSSHTFTLTALKLVEYTCHGNKILVYFRYKYFLAIFCFHFSYLLRYIRYKNMFLVKKPSATFRYNQILQMPWLIERRNCNATVRCSMQIFRDMVWPLQVLVLSTLGWTLFKKKLQFFWNMKMSFI